MEPITFSSGFQSLSPTDKATYYSNLLGQGYTDQQIRAAANQQFGTQSDADWNYLRSLVPQTTTTTLQPGVVPSIQNLPAPLPAGTNTQSRIDPALQPYLQMGLQRAQQLFMGGFQPSLFPGQMYVSPSEQTLLALQQQEALAKAAQPALEQAQQSYMSALGGLGQTASGAFLGGSPYRQQMIESATRPLTQKFQTEVLPGIASGFSKAGRYGSGAMGQAIGQASEQFGRAVGDVASNLTYADYARERQAQQQAQMGQAALAQAAPSFFQMGFLPSQSLAQVGAAREAISAQPLQEQIRRYEYAQQIPYQQLQGYLSSVYGTPMSSSQAIFPQAQTNPIGQALGLGTLGYLGGSAIGGTTLGMPTSTLGALGGGLLGYYL